MYKNEQFNFRKSFYLTLFLLTTNVHSYPSGLEVDVENESVMTRCAEEDNIYLKLISPKVTSFIVEARHPKYIHEITKDYKGNVNHCHFLPSPSKALPPLKTTRTTIYETEDWQLVGLTYPDFWRKRDVPIRVGQKKVTGIHLLQLWTRVNERAEEVLVLYPLDGYWRARPLPPKNRCWTAYGSSFLVGPVEFNQRPYVDIKEVVFLPKKHTFVIKFMDGQTATLHLSKLNQSAIVLNVQLSSPVKLNKPFAALRSMFVQEDNADVSKISWLSKNKLKSQESSIIDVKKFRALNFWTGRTLPSKHNTSAPDVVFRDFK